MVLFKLSEVLEKVMPGITSKNVKLVMHAADSVEINGMRVDGYTPYSLYISNPESFLLYQSEQRTDLFKNVDYIISFIGEDGTTARMIGVFKVDGYDDERRDKNDPKHFYYKLSEVEAFRKTLSERVIIDWGAPRPFCQNLKFGTKDKDVIAIERQGLEWKFQSYEQVLLEFNVLKRIIDGNSGIWKNKLTAVKGIYVISDKATGKLYVGKADNVDGIWGRWKEYVNTGGHGGNVKLKKLLAKKPNYAIDNLRWGILQTCSLRIATKELDQLESQWKEKLSRKACSYNGN